MRLKFPSSYATHAVQKKYIKQNHSTATNDPNTAEKLHDKLHVINGNLI